VKSNHHEQSLLSKSKSASGDRQRSCDQAIPSLLAMILLQCLLTLGQTTCHAKSCAWCPPRLGFPISPLASRSNFGCKVSVAWCFPRVCATMHRLSAPSSSLSVNGKNLQFLMGGGWDDFGTDMHTAVVSRCCLLAGRQSRCAV
jgi:hypothetical protein